MATLPERLLLVSLTTTVGPATPGRRSATPWPGAAVTDRRNLRGICPPGGSPRGGAGS
jgi:hypothetical protein